MIKDNILNKSLLLLGLILISSWQLSAREIIGFEGKSHDLAKTASDCQAATAQTELNINNVRTRLLAGGDLWWDLSDARYEIPKVVPGSGEPSRHSLFAGALWIGGIDALGQLKVAAQTYRQTGNDFYPGPLDNNGQVNKDICKNFDNFWKVEAEEINLFLQAYEISDGNISFSNIPESILGWPARNNQFFVEFNDFALPADKDLAPFWDENDDGEYNPLDGDYPVIDQTNEGVYADQMIWWIFNDRGNAHSETGGEAIGLQISALAFGFATNDEVNNMSFYKYVIENNSSSSLDSVFFSQWVDPDLGNFDDDYVGCDTLNDLGIVYNGDGFDDGLQGYGDNVPVLAVDFFKGPNDENGKQLGMNSFLYYDNNFTTTGNPETVTHFYGYMAGAWKDGSPFTFGGNGYGGSEPFDFIFPGDPSDPEGWSECTDNNPPADRRFLQTSGPFRLDPGVVNDVIVGVVWVRDGTWTPCSSFRSLLNADKKAQALFDSGFKQINGPDAPNMTIRELDKELVLTLWNSPSSNNDKEEYEEAEPVLRSVGIGDSLYKFQGYRIYQLKNSTVTPGDFGNPSLAREIATVDIADGVGTIINYQEDALVGSVVPTLEVEGNDQGVDHTFQITQDAFAVGDNKLVNYKRYYYSVIAYAYNGYTLFDPNNPNADPNAQKLPYLAGRNNVEVYTAIPHLPANQFGGSFNAQYGDGPEITQISGVGNGGNELELTQTSVDAIVANSSIEDPVYVGGAGPIGVKVFDPSLIPNRRFRVKILDNAFFEFSQGKRGGTVSIDDNGNLFYEAPAEGNISTDNFSYTIIDQFGKTDVGSIVVELDGSSVDFGGAFMDTRSVHGITGAADNDLNIDVLVNDDVSIATNVEITEFTQPESGTVVLEGNNTFTYTPTQGDPFGIHVFNYTIKDNAGAGITTSAQVWINITNSADGARVEAVDDIIDLNANSGVVTGPLDNDNSLLLAVDGRINPSATWVLSDADSGEILEVSEKSIASANEQAIGGYEKLGENDSPFGFTVNVEQTINASEGNAVISGELTFEQTNNQWLTTISDGESTSEFNWIRGGDSEDASGFAYNDFRDGFNGPFLDAEGNYEELLDGGVAPYTLVANPSGSLQVGETESFVLPISPGCSDCGSVNGQGIVSDNRLGDVQSVDVIFTPNKELWTQCVVVEMGRFAGTNQGLAEKNAMRQAPSIDKDGNQLDETGRSWFPGYAINVATGERLNICLVKILLLVPKTVVIWFGIQPI